LDVAGRAKGDQGGGIFSWWWCCDRVKELGRQGMPNPTNKEAGYHLATTQLPPATAWLPLATIGNRGVANPRYL